MALIIESINLAISTSWSMQSKAFERSVRTTAVYPPESRDWGHFSITAIKQCCGLNPFPKPHWYFEKICLGKGESGSA